MTAWSGRCGRRPLPAQKGTTEERPTSTPYSGDLSIFEYPDRDKKLQIDRVMDLLGITTGKNVADIGAGSGWFTVRAARRVGPTGAVIAEDINPLAIEYIGKRVVKEDLSNVRTVLGAPDDPRLPAGSVDAVLMLKVYHEIAHPVPTMKVLQTALRRWREGGDHRQERRWVEPWAEPRCGGEGDGRGRVQAGGDVRLYQGGWAGLFSDLSGAVEAARW